LITLHRCNFIILDHIYVEKMILRDKLLLSILASRVLLDQILTPKNVNLTNIKRLYCHDILS